MKIRNLLGKKELIGKELENLFKIEHNSKNEVSKERLKNWYDIHSEGYWVGEENGEVLAYAYFIRLNGRDINVKERWEEITENGSCKTHKKNGDVLFLVALGTRVFNGENFLMKGILKEIDNGFYERVYDIYACSRVPNLDKKSDLYFSEDSMVKLFRKNKFIVMNIEEEKVNESDFKSFNLLVKRRINNDNRLKLIWKKVWH